MPPPTRLDGTAIPERREALLEFVLFCDFAAAESDRLEFARDVVAMQVEIAP